MVAPQPCQTARKDWKRQESHRERNPGNTVLNTLLLSLLLGKKKPFV